MRLEVLGSGGAVVTPKPFCSCESCTQARKRGPRWSRLGPSVFIHGPDILIDTPEEISVELNRSSIKGIKACLYSHWHPDHTAGRRVFALAHVEEPDNVTLAMGKRLSRLYSKGLGKDVRIAYDAMSIEA